LIDPVLRVVFFFLAFSWCAAREAIGPVVFICRDMNKFEVEKKDRGDPVIDRRIRLYVRVT